MPQSVDRTRLPEPGSLAHVRLITVDMDGTLLDEHKRPSPVLPRLLDVLDRRGVRFTPASGRQYANVAERLGRPGADLTYVAENGAHVVRHGRDLHVSRLAPHVVEDLVRTVRALQDAGADGALVLGGTQSAYVERHDPEFMRVAEEHYTLLTPVEDLLAVDAPMVKAAVYDRGDVHDIVAPALERFAGAHEVVVSGTHWVDVMNAGTHKGAAVRRLQEEYGISPAETMAFGDFPNDLQMLAAAEHSFAMANAHPDVLAAARYVAPSNNQDGVVRAIVSAMGLQMADVVPL